MKSIYAVGIDAAYANMGFASVIVNIGPTGRVGIHCLGLNLVSTKSESHKSVRKNSEELRRAKELHAALQRHCAGASFAFVEVPSGSQSASAARGLGIAVGVLSSCPIPVIEVSPMEVKVAVTGDRKIKADKANMIAWAVERWPKADWLREKKSGRIIKANEHLADALATVAAGVATPEFQRIIQMVTNNETARAPVIGPAPSLRRRVLV